MAIHKFLLTATVALACSGVSKADTIATLQLSSHSSDATPVERLLATFTFTVSMAGDHLTLRVANDTVPIGLDEGEAVEQMPSVAGEVLDVPACRVEPLVTYTVVNWDAPEGEARVKIAQGSAVEEQIRTSGIFPNVDAAWKIEGVTPSLASAAPPAPLTTESISGRVTLPDGSGVAGVGVLLRTRFRVRLSDGDTSNDPDAGFSDPIAFTLTDESGAFSINRPAGGYQLEFFSDDFTFRPAAVTLETPIEVVQIIAEPL